MALKPILTSGVALASAAAIIAATPELMPAPTVEVAAAQSMPTPTQISSAKYELTALSLRNALNALFEGYDGGDSLHDPLSDEHAEQYGVDLNPDGKLNTGDEWDPWVGFGVEALLYYLIDEGLASLGVTFHHDDILFSAGQTALFNKIAQDLNLDGLLAFISNPLIALPPEVGDFLTDPVGLVEDTALEPILQFFHDPVGAIPLLELLVALPTIIVQSTPLDILADPAAYLPPALAAFVTHPLGTIVQIIGVLIPNDEDLVEPDDDTAGQRSFKAAVEGEGISEEGEEGEAAAEDQKPSPFAAVTLPSPIEFRDDLAAKAKEALGALKPKDSVTETVVEDKVEGVDEGKTESAPEADKKPGLPSLSDTISDAKAKAKEAKAERAEKRAERKESFRSALGLKPRTTSGPEAGAKVGGGDDNGGGATGGGATGGGTEGGES